MNVFHKVTLQSLKRNKTRTVVTVIGIMLSAAMICAVTAFISSLYNYALENAVYNNGDWHGSALSADRETYETIRTAEEVETAVCGQQLGYAIAEGCKNENKPYLYILGASADFAHTMPIHITGGRYPTAADELLLPMHLSANGGVTHTLGDTLTLAVGDRMSEGHALGQHNPFILNGSVPTEELAVRETRTYTVVGFYERPDFEAYSAPGYTAITLADAEPSASYRYDVWFKLENASDVYDFMEEHAISGDTNSEVLYYSGVSRYETLDGMITGLAAIVIGLIMFGSVSLIYNAFSISVSERTKQFGLLTSVGATKKQLRRMVLFEALAVSAVGIPLGILVGIGGIGITLLLIGHMFESLIDSPIPLRISVSSMSVVVAAVIALVTVLISAWIPSKRATKVSAVEAIRQHSDIHAGSKEVKTSKLVYTLFGLPGMLANKHYKRSRKKYRSTVISLFMSVVLFISASAFTDYLTESASQGFFTEGYDLRYFCSAENLAAVTEDELLEHLRNDNAVTDAAYVYGRTLGGETANQYLTEQAIQALKFTTSETNGESDTTSVPIYLGFVNDAEYRELLAANKLDEAVYMDPEAPLAVAFDGSSAFDYEEEKFVTLNYLRSDTSEIVLSVQKELDGYYYDGDEIDENGMTLLRYRKTDDPEEFICLTQEEAFEAVTVRSGKTLYEKPYYVEGHRGLTLLYPDSFKTVILPNRNTPYNYNYYFLSDDHSASYTALKQTLTEQGLSSDSLVDYAAMAEENRNVVIIVQVFAYGFIMLISLIAAANVFNTISTNISLRRREFAMLKSVGMSAKGFHRMMNYECLLYGTRALLYGLPASVGVTYLIHRAASEGFTTTFRLPWAAIGIAVLSVFAVVFVTMLYSMSKIKKDNPIDALKNENL